MPSLQCSSLLIRLFLVFVLLSQTVFGAIENVFNIKQGPIGVGGCDSHRALLRRWWTDAMKLVDAGLEYAADDSEDGAPYMSTFFGLDPPPNDEEQRKTARRNLQAVKDFIHGNKEPELGEPWLFCSSKWLKGLDWDELAYDPATGEKYPDDEDKTKVTKVRDLVKPPDDNFENYFPLWSPHFKNYILDESPDDFCSRQGNLGATSEDFSIPTLTICVQNMKYNYDRDHLNIGLIRTEGKSIKKYDAQSMTLFHELFHVVLGKAKTYEQPSWYSLDWIKEADTDDALWNPESYAMYALACLLGQKNPKYSFASTASKLKEIAST